MQIMTGHNLDDILFKINEKESSVRKKPQIIYYI